jgi:hypothetical protein
MKRMHVVPLLLAAEIVLFTISARGADGQTSLSDLARSPRRKAGGREGPSLILTR